MIMTFKSWHFILVTLFLVLGMLHTPQALAQTQVDDPSVIEKPPTLTVGDTFEYRGYRSLDDAKEGRNPRMTHIREVTEVYEDGSFRLKTVGESRYILYNSAGNIIERNRKDLTKRTYTPSSSSFRYPMKVGDKFNISYYFDRNKIKPDMNTINRKGTVRVIGWETVTVPAGTFRALRIEVSGDYEVTPIGRSGTFKQIYLVSPRVKMKPVIYIYKARWEGGRSKNMYMSLSRFSVK